MQKLSELYLAVNAPRATNYYAEAVTDEWNEYNEAAQSGSQLDMNIEAIDIVVRCVQLIKALGEVWDIDALLRGAVVKTILRQHNGKDKELEKIVLAKVLDVKEVIPGDVQLSK